MAKWSHWQFSSIDFNGSTLKGTYVCVILQVKEVHSPYFQFQITSSLLWSPHFVFHLKDLIREILMPCSLFQAKLEHIKNLMLIQRKIADIMAEIRQLPSGFLHLVSCRLPCRVEGSDCSVMAICVRCVKTRYTSGTWMVAGLYMIKFRFYLNACQVGFKSVFSFICWCYSHGSV